MIGLTHRQGCYGAEARVRLQGGSREDTTLGTNAAAPARTRDGKAASQTSSPANVSDATLGRLSEVFGCLADRSRLKILLALAEAGELHVSALCGLLDQKQPAVSHHLTLLRLNGLVGFRRNGKHNYYRVESALLRDLLEQLFADAGNGHKLLQFDGFNLAYRRK